MVTKCYSSDYISLVLYIIHVIIYFILLMPLFKNLYFLVMLGVWPGMLKAKLLHHATDS